MYSKIKIVAYLLISMSIFLAVWFIKDDFLQVTGRVSLSTVVGFAAIASGVSGIIMSLSSKRTAIFEAIREYYQQGDTSEMISNRNKIYATENSEVELDKKAASEVCSFFNFWGMMVRKNFLPIWVFASASGPSVVRLYKILTPYIEERRATNNTLYAREFEYLVDKIKRKYKVK